jgi:hypothetical protein
MLRPRYWVYLFLLFLVFILLFVLTLQALATLSGTFVVTEVRMESTVGSNKEHPVIYEYPVSGLNYSSGLRFGITTQNGLFKYRSGKPIQIKLRAIELGYIEGNEKTAHTTLPNSQNIFTLLVALDADGDRKNGIQITQKSLPDKNYFIDVSMPEKAFRKKLINDLAQKGRFTLTTNKGRKVSVSGIEYISGVEDGQTALSGRFTYQQNKKITFRINNTIIGALEGKAELSPMSFNSPVNKNLLQYLYTFDKDNNPDNGIVLSSLANSIKIDFTLAEEAFELALAKALSKHTLYPNSTFSPSIGINLEAAQAEADNVGQPMPFVDIFRTARPFREFSDKSIQYDEDGWPIAIPADKKAYTILLQNLPKNAIPYGRYTVLYDGIGTLAYDGLAKRVDFSANKDIIHIHPNNSTINQLVLRITETHSTNPIRNIRVIMPGGICEDIPYLRVDDKNDCAVGHYRSFANLLKDRNNIIFNPDYLRLIRNFKVLRMMNLMEASQRPPVSCNIFRGEDYQDCLKQPSHWGQRSKMTDSVWGGSYRTDATKKHGVPIEVLVALANQSNRSPWFTIPHNATDDYIEEFADYVYNNLNPHLKVYLEYSNETWNERFWGARYARLKGRELALDNNKNPFREGLRYYATRAVEVFQLWEEYFEDSENRLIKIISSHQSAPNLSTSILRYNNTYKYVDALAIAPYFHMCSNRKHRACKNGISSPIPTLLPDISTLDNLFKALNNKNDPYALPATIRNIKQHAQIAKKFKVKLFAYEGGQHLTVDWQDKEHTKKEKEQQLVLLEKANEDPRMANFYQTLLQEWKLAGGALFTSFTLPQKPHRWGAWGIKTHLNQPRKNAPKYDAIMHFQEQQAECWWSNCVH